MDKEFWKNFYTKESLTSEPTAFAKECIKRKFVVPGQKLLELGHGNGRDAKFFFSQGINVTGVDQAGLICNDNGLKLIRGDFVDYLNCLPYNYFDCIYSRFSLHSITELDQSDVLSITTESLLVSKGTFLIECRTIYDSLCGKGERIGRNTFFLGKHSRRFIQPGELIQSLLCLGFIIDYCELKSGFAKYKDEDPIVLRICAKKLG